MVKNVNGTTMIQYNQILFDTDHVSGLVPSPGVKSKKLILKSASNIQ